MFCKNCGSLVHPKNGKYHCENCDKDGVDNSKRKTISKESTAQEIAVVDENVATLPKTQEICPNCGFTEAYYVLRQTRSADEPETKIFRCCKCNHSWREY